MAATTAAITAAPLAGACAVADVAALAAAVLPAGVRDFVDGGSGTELTLAANRAAWDRVQIEPRVLRAAAGCRTDTELLGRRAALPVALAPMAYQRLVHPDGELGSAAAAAQAGVPFVVSTLSSVAVEDVVALGGDVWWQQYWLRDRAATRDLVRRAADAGCRAVVLTVDVPWMGRRLRDVRNGFRLPAGVSAAHLAARSQAHDGGGASAVAAHTAAVLEPGLTWAAVAELRSWTDLPLVVKGVLAPEDAVRAAEHGADAVVVSNHGGRQLDGAVPPARRLAAVRAALVGSAPGRTCQVLVDSGIRSGTDVVRALALGADGVLLGRPVLWGLAVGGRDGVAEVLRLLAEEVRDALGLAGCATPAEAGGLRTFDGSGSR